MAKKNVVILTETQREELKQLIAAGKAPARKLAHARVLLKADEGLDRPALTDEQIADAVEVGIATVSRIRKQFVAEGMAVALNRRAPRREYRRKLDGAQEAQLLALACSTPPEGQKRWTLRLLADRMVSLEYVDELSHVTVLRTLKKTNSSHG